MSLSVAPDGQLHPYRLTRETSVYRCARPIFSDIKYSEGLFHIWRSRESVSRPGP